MRALLPAFLISALACGPSGSDSPDAGADASTASKPPLDAGSADAGAQPQHDAGMVAPISYANDIKPIWSAHCVSCHSNANNGINLAAANAYDQLLLPGNPCFDQQTGMNLPYAIVEPGDPEKSILWIKLRTDLLLPTSPQCNREMPAVGVGLAFSHPEEAEKVRLWIEQGALDN